MSQIPWQKMRNLCIPQGDVRAKLEEIIATATELLKDYPKPKTRADKKGRDRMDRSGHDREE
jgi:hypothetical protein